MRLRDAIDVFLATRETAVLRMILAQHGKRGFRIACKIAKLREGEAKRLLGIYDDTTAIRQVAAKACGLRLSGRNWR